MGLGYRNAGGEGSDGSRSAEADMGTGTACSPRPACSGERDCWWFQTGGSLSEYNLKGQGLSGLGLLAMSQPPGSATRGGPAWGV